MDRVLIYPGQIPLETDLLQSNKNAMIALSKLAAAVLGVSTLVNGLAVVPTGPASLNVSVGPGEIYSLQNIDNGAYSSLAADAAHQIVKQGIMLDARILACAAPATAGQSVNYLVQATYADVDSGNVVLPYYNASNPATAYSGPNNTGAAQSTLRQGLVTLSVKAGAAAATGSQVTPAPDAGYVGVAVVTVANGQTTINTGNIATYAGAPIVNSTLLGQNPVFGVPLAVPNALLAAHAVNLSQFTTGQTLGVSGSQPMPGGLILKWGSTLTSATADVPVTFPLQFPNACYGVCAMYSASTTGGFWASSNSRSATGFNLASWTTSARAAAQCDWFAWGK